MKEKGCFSDSRQVAIGNRTYLHQEAASTAQSCQGLSPCPKLFFSYDGPFRTTRKAFSVGSWQQSSDYHLPSKESDGLQLFFHLKPTKTHHIQRLSMTISHPLRLADIRTCIITWKTVFQLCEARWHQLQNEYFTMPQALERLDSSSPRDRSGVRSPTQRMNVQWPP